MADPDDGTRRAAGEQVVRDMLGEEFLHRHLVAAADGEGLHADAARYALEACFGDIWARPGLDRRSRSLITLGVLMAQGHQWEIHNHVLAGLANGLTEEELLEAAFHTSPYIGLPAAGQAMATVTKTLKEAQPSKPPAG